MLILPHVLALALIVADEPKAPLATPAETSSTSEIRKLPGHAGPEVVWHLTLPEAIRIGLDNSEVVRVISLGGPKAPGGDSGANPAQDATPDRPARPAGIVIARLNADASTWNFQAAMMAHVRSIEQQYWALSYQSIVLWSRETAVRLGEEILRRERAELEVSRSTKSDVAEAEQQLENFQLNLVTATSDLMTTEKQLRNILGLAPSDGRRIVAETAPTEARLEPDWETSVRAMMESQPDVVQQTVLVRLTELQLLMARNQLLPLSSPDLLHAMNQLGQANLLGSIVRDAVLARAAATDPAGFRDPEFIEHQVGLTAKPEPLGPAPDKVEPGAVFQSGGTFSMPIGFRSPLANTRQAQYQLLRQRAFLQQIVHQTTHSLARFFLEVDANYKQFRTAQRLRTAAQQRLEAQRAFYEEGRVTIDRLLDAVSQYSNAIATEAQYKSSYNTSIAALEEAKGTLLAYDHITVADGPAPRKTYIQGKDDRLAQGKDDQLAPAAFDGPSPKPEVAPSPAPAAPTSYKIKAKIGGLKVLEIEVEASPTPKP